jgi:thioredoxin reductase (NADPH)
MPIATDALIIGAGPVGLFQVFQLGLQGVSAHVVDALPHAGGQCVTLYADKPIYDIPGIPVCTGRELTEQLLRQIEPFAPQFHWNQLVSTIERQADGRFLVGTAAHSRPQSWFLTKTLFIAAGVGAFQPRHLKLDGAALLEGTQIHYDFASYGLVANHVALDPTVTRHVVILGDGEKALEAALSLANTNFGQSALPAQQIRVSVLHRREVFNADAAIVSQFRAQLDAGNVHFVAGQIAGLDISNHRLAALQVLHADGLTKQLACEQLLVLQGLSPKLGPVAEWGLAMERKQLAVDSETFSTSTPGIFAVGDINTYPGKKKLILCGFHECVLAAFGAMQVIQPDEKVLLQYTTTSSKLHKRLGVLPGPTF